MLFVRAYSSGFLKLPSNRDQARRGIADAGGRLSGITIALLETRRTVPGWAWQQSNSRIFA
ncbi:MAG: hypothetical protein ACJ8FP_26265 [Xanthobacteraceae bacterium]|jgi:hypothetical protein